MNSTENKSTDDIAKFMEHFEINKIDVYGNSSDELKEFVKAFGLPFYFHPAYAKFSRN